jgi:hypothetical protein
MSMQSFPTPPHYTDDRSATVTGELTLPAGDYSVPPHSDYLSIIGRRGVLLDTGIGATSQSSFYA